MGRMELAKMIDALRGDDDDDDGMGRRRNARISHEGQIARLRDAAPRFARNNPFKVGDFVTPVGDCNLKGAGEPHLVVAVMDTSGDFCEGTSVEPGLPYYGVKPDLRVASIMQGCLLAFWERSENFVAYEGDASK